MDSVCPNTPRQLTSERLSRAECNIAAFVLAKPHGLFGNAGRDPGTDPKPFTGSRAYGSGSPQRVGGIDPLDADTSTCTLVWEVPVARTAPFLCCREGVDPNCLRACSTRC